VKLCCSVGKKFISLDACSILTVYNGVDNAKGLAVAAAARNAIATLIIVSGVFGLFTLSPPFKCFML
jgi:hypothetical protein